MAVGCFFCTPIFFNSFKLTEYTKLATYIIEKHGEVCQRNGGIVAAAMAILKCSAIIITAL